ncbi:MAG TPA: hypothetical protein VJY35_05690 [Candidatus Eisenbacteria bacterium]|nr:hypothetical protein [Candidatus Eisenbacteria bacterium]
MKHPVVLRPALWPLALVAIAYHAAFVWRASFVVDGARYFCLFDDAMISMRYARHLAGGQGLVWNPGEPPVEGFSNPLWTLVMSAVHFVPLPPRLLGILVEALGSLLLVALLFAVRGLCVRLVERGAPRALPWVAMVLVGSYQPLVFWTLEGTEVGLLALWATVAAILLLDGCRLGATYALLAAGTLVRMDFAVIALALAAGVAVLDRGRAATHAATAAMTLLAALALQTAARWLYFHDPLPNTYYLKLTGYPIGARVLQGLAVLWDTIVLSRGLLVLLPALGLALAPPGARARVLVLTIPFVATCGYSVWVGGDAWEGAIATNRYLCVTVPLLLIAAAWPLAWLAQRVARGRRGEPALAAFAAVACALVIAPWRATTLIEPPAYREVNAENTARAVAAVGLVREGGSVAAAAVGAIGYYTDRRIVDLLGKSDRHVARLPMHRASKSGLHFVPGHLKWDYAWSIGELKPDVVAQLWWNPREAQPFFERDYDVVRAVVDGRSLDLGVRRGSRFTVAP